MSEDTAQPELASPELALASIAAAELVLAKHREPKFAALVERVKAADLPGLASDIRDILKLLNSPADRALMEQRAVVLADTPKFLSSMADANTAQLAKAAGG